MLINLVEHSDLNRNKLMVMQTRPGYENSDQDARMLAYNSLVEVGYKQNVIGASCVDRNSTTVRFI